MALLIDSSFCIQHLLKNKVRARQIEFGRISLHSKNQSRKEVITFEHYTMSIHATRHQWIWYNSARNDASIWSIRPISSSRFRIFRCLERHWRLGYHGKWKLEWRGDTPSLPTGPTMEAIGHVATQEIVLQWPDSAVGPCIGPSIEIDSRFHRGDVYESEFRSKKTSILD